MNYINSNRSVIITPDVQDGKTPSYVFNTDGVYKFTELYKASAGPEDSTYSYSRVERNHYEITDIKEIHRIIDNIQDERIRWECTKMIFKTV